MTDFPESRARRDHRFQGDKHEISDRNIRIANEMINDPELSELRDRDAPLMEILRHPKVRRRLSEMREYQ